MFQRISIENFIRIPHLDLAIKRPVLLIAGGNEQGKTSVKEAIQFVLRGDNPRVKHKKDFVYLLTQGAKRGHVELTFQNYTVRRNVRDGAATGDTDALPTDTVLMDVCIGVSSFMDMKEAERRGLLMKVMGAALTPERISAELRERGFTDSLIRRYEPIYKHGLAAAHDKAARIESEKVGEWRGITGEAYGEKKAETWKPKTAGVSVAELQQAVSELDAHITKLHSDRDEELQPVLARIAEMNTIIDSPAGLTCPHCKKAVIYEGGKLKPHDPHSAEAKATQEKLRNLQYQKRDDINFKYKERINGTHTDKQALVTQIRDEESAGEKQRKAMEAHEEIKAAAVLKGLFGDGPDGIMGRFIAASTKPFNERLAELAAAIGWQPVSVGGDMLVRRADGVPYFMFSESAKWRADMMVHTVLAERGSFPWLVFDRLDVLEPAERPKFVQWAAAYTAGAKEVDFTIVALATLKAKPDTAAFPSIQTEWIADGQIAPEG